MDVVVDDDERDSKTKSEKRTSIHEEISASEEGDRSDEKRPRPESKDVELKLGWWLYELKKKRTA